MIEVIIYCFLGSLIGFLTGLIPSIHQNILIPIFLIFLTQDKILAITFLASLAISQNFGNAISSYYLSAPPEELSLSTLPSQRLAKKGFLLEVLKIYIISAVTCTPLAILLSLFFHSYISTIILNLRDFIPLMILSVLYTIFFFENKKMRSLIVFLLAGILGIISFNITEFNKAVMAMFSGFFAIPQLIINFLKKDNFLKNQVENAKINLSKKNILIGIFISVFLGIFAGLLPSLGTSQMVLVFQPFINDRMFIFLNAGTSFSNEIFSITSSYIVGNPRSGLSVYLEQTFGKLDYQTFILILASFSLSLFFGSIFFILSYKKFFRFFQETNFKILNFILILIIVSIIFVFSGLIGLIILFTSTSLSFFTFSLNVKRSYLMGSLILSTILIYTNLYPRFLNLIGI